MSQLYMQIGATDQVAVVRVQEGIQGMWGPFDTEDDAQSAADALRASFGANSGTWEIHSMCKVIKQGRGARKVGEDG